MTTEQDKQAIRVLFIPADTERPVEVRDLPAGDDGDARLEDMQSLVGGYIEVAPVPEEAGDMSIFINEEGKLEGLPLNIRATQIWSTCWGNIRLDDVLVGDAFIAGGTDDEGRTLSAPDRLLRPFEDA